MALYAVAFSAVAVTAQQDLIQLAAPSSGVVFIHRATISQSSDVGDAAEEGLTLLLKRGTTASTIGTGTTPVPLETAGAAYGGTAAVNQTTKMASGTISTLHAEAWNIRGGFDYLPTPETRIVLSPSQKFGLELATTPADSITVSGTLVFESLGG